MRSKPVPGLLVLPGWHDRGPQLTKALKAALQPLGWVCRRVDLPDSSWPADWRAEMSRDDVLRQALEDHDRLQLRLNGGPMTVLGFSFGAYIAAFVAAARQADRLVLRSPALYPDDGWTTPKEALDELKLESYRSVVHDTPSNGALRCCAQFRGDVLLIDSEKDQVIPWPVIASYQGSFTNARSLSRCTLRGADHQLTEQTWQDGYRAAVLGWLRDHPGQTAPKTAS